MNKFKKYLFEKFTAKMTAFETNLNQPFKEGKDLEKEIMENLKGLRYE